MLFRSIANVNGASRPKGVGGNFSVERPVHSGSDRSPIMSRNHSLGDSSHSRLATPGQHKAAAQRPHPKTSNWHCRPGAEFQASELPVLKQSFALNLKVGSVRTLVRFGAVPKSRRHSCSFTDVCPAYMPICFETKQPYFMDRVSRVSVSDAGVARHTPTQVRRSHSRGRLPSSAVSHCLNTKIGARSSFVFR